MKRHRYQWVIGGLVLLVAFMVGLAVYQTQRRPKSLTTVNDDLIRVYYRQWQREYLSGQQQKFVLTRGAEHPQALSESQGYGMLITVLAAKHGMPTRQTFDQLVAYYLAHRVSPTNPLMAWRQKQVGQRMHSTPAEMTSATDGDLDIAYALILADDQWGSIGSVDYKGLAQQLIRAIKQYEIDPVTQLPRVGNWATTPATQHLVRPSDLMTAYFRRFARYMQDGEWTQVALNSQTVLQKLSQQRSSGLMPDFTQVSGDHLTIRPVHARQVASPYDNQYGFNACRVPWRVAYDYQLSRSPVSRDVTAKMLAFFARQSRITAVYTLTGRPVETYPNQAFSAPVAYAAQVMGHQRLVTRYAPSLKRVGASNAYYPATLQMLLLLQSGELPHD